MKNYVKEGQKLPLYGVGPMIVFGMGMVTAIGIILFACAWKTGILEGPWALVCRIAGALLIVSGLAVWFIGALRSDMDASIAENRLQTGGIYAWVRNPMYGIMTFCLFRSTRTIPNTPTEWRSRRAGKRYSFGCGQRRSTPTGRRNGSGC